MHWAHGKHEISTEQTISKQEDLQSWSSLLFLWWLFILNLEYLVYKDIGLPASFGPIWGLEGQDKQSGISSEIKCISGRPALRLICRLLLKFSADGSYLGRENIFLFPFLRNKGLKTVDICFDEVRLLRFKMIKTLAPQIQMFLCCFIAGEPSGECVAFISFRWIVNITSCTEHSVTLCFVLIFPARRMLMMFTSAWRIIYWLLSGSPPPGPGQTQQTRCRSQNVAVVAVWCLVQLRASSWS